MGKCFEQKRIESFCCFYQETDAAVRTSAGKSLSATDSEAIKSEPVIDAVNESLTKARLDASKIDTESLPEILSSLKMSPSKVKNVVLDDLLGIKIFYPRKVWREMEY